MPIMFIQWPQKIFIYHLVGIKPIRQFYVACQVSIWDAKLTLVVLLLRFDIECFFFILYYIQSKIKCMFESVFSPHFGQLGLSVKPHEARWSLKGSWHVIVLNVLD